MKGQLRYDVEAENQRDLERLRDTVADTLRDMGVTVTTQASSFATQPFTLVGAFRGKPDVPWRAVIDAADEEDARAQALKEDDTRTINLCVPGDLLPPEPDEVPAE